MKNSIIYPKVSSRHIAIAAIAGVALLVAVPALSAAATFAYVNQAGNVATVDAATPTQAMATAPNIDAHSGVMLLTYETSTGLSSNAFSPVITNVSLSTGTNSASIDWNTSLPAAAIVYYSTTPIMMTEASANSAVTISGTSQLVHTDLRTSHSASLTGLLSGTTYYYVLYVRDGAGNESIAWPATFRTN
ncbi:MAG: fibronectin type III domain-containing protein [Patescibacteria group bacterium]